MRLNNFYTRDPKTKEVRHHMEDMTEIQSDNQVARTEVGDLIVSTDFLNLDQGDSGPPLLWVTMVYEGNYFYKIQLRYSSEKNAEVGHTLVVQFIEDGGDLDEFKGV